MTIRCANNPLTSVWSPSSTADARSQPPSSPLAAQSNTQDDLRNPAANEGGPEEQILNVSRSSTQHVPTTMSAAEDMRTQEPLGDYTTSLADQRTITKARVPETAFSEATLLDGAGSRKASISVIIEKSDESQSIRSSERDDPFPPSATRGRLAQGLATLIDKHTEVLAVRVNTEESRTKLRTRRHALGQLDAQYVEELETVFENTLVEQVANLKQNFAKLQLARGEILALEVEYEEEATRLLQLEAELRHLESKMYRKLAESPVNSLGQMHAEILNEDLAEQVLSESDVAEWDDRVEHSPEIRAYLSQLGDLNMLRERLMDKDTQYVQVTEENALREEIGLEPEEDAEDFLASFEAEREALITQMKEAEIVLANLAANLEQPENLPIRGNPFADLARRPEGPSREHSLFGKDDYFDDDAAERYGLADEQVLAAAAALLLSQEDSRLVYENVVTDTDGISIEKASYINAWQLHRLRKSTREVVRLVHEQQAAGVWLSAEDLKGRVLETWMHDATTRHSEFPHFDLHARDLSMATHSGASRHSRPASHPALQAWQTNEQLLQRRVSTSHAETTR